MSTSPAHQIQKNKTQRPKTHLQKLEVSIFHPHQTSSQANTFEELFTIPPLSPCNRSNWWPCLETLQDVSIATYLSIYEPSANPFFSSFQTSSHSFPPPPFIILGLLSRSLSLQLTTRLSLGHTYSRQGVKMSGGREGGYRGWGRMTS